MRKTMLTTENMIKLNMQLILRQTCKAAKTAMFGLCEKTPWW